MNANGYSSATLCFHHVVHFESQSLLFTAVAILKKCAIWALFPGTVTYRKWYTIYEYTCMDTNYIILACLQVQGMSQGKLMLLHYSKVSSMMNSQCSCSLLSICWSLALFVLQNHILISVQFLRKSTQHKLHTSKTYYIIQTERQSVEPCCMHRCYTTSVAERLHET